MYPPLTPQTFPPYTSRFPSFVSDSEVWSETRNLWHLTCSWDFKEQNQQNQHNHNSLFHVFLWNAGTWHGDSNLLCFMKFVTTFFLASSCRKSHRNHHRKINSLKIHPEFRNSWCVTQFLPKVMGLFYLHER